MNCPACDKPMIVLEIDQVEVDHCVGCGGTWLDAGELDLLLEGAANRERLLAGLEEKRDAKEAPVRCPICSKKMTKVECGKVVLDKCKKNDGMWFDHGELREVAAMGKFPGDNRVALLLNEIFGDK